MITIKTKVCDDGVKRLCDMKEYPFYSNKIVGKRFSIIHLSLQELMTALEEDEQKCLKYLKKLKGHLVKENNNR
ncbi:MAG TPA: hypothetical protein VFM18_04840 [Methanosarcina sp.]|nr:hypothetical protein [Methanosarcina sp.]